jgi:hypothetical protein
MDTSDASDDASEELETHMDTSVSDTLYDGDPEGKVEWDLSSLGSVEFEELSD